MATQARIERKRMNERNGHSVKCWNSKWSSCTCTHTPHKDKGKD